MTIKVTYNVTDVYVTQDVSPVYINVSYSSGGGGGAAVWGGITGTLSDQTDLQSALDAKVPYTGATTNVNLGEYEIKAGQVTLDTSPTGTAAVGTTRWNDTTGLTETTLKGGSVILKNGVDLVARVVNKVSPNTTLTKAAYQAVRVSGAQGQRLAVALAQANNDANSADTIGLVTETIATNQEGFIMTVGQLENINTTGSLQSETWADGDVLYLSPTIAGAITKVKPTGNGHIVVIGYVEYAHANNGKIYVKVMNGWELDELHDVAIVTPLNNEALIYESATALWKNKSIATALGYTPANAATTLTINGVTYDLSANRSWTVSGGISGSGASGQVAYWTGTSAQAGSNNLFWDNSTNRLGIGTNSPADQLHISNNSVFVNTILRLSVHPNHANIISFRNADGTGQGGFLATGSSFSYGTYITNQVNLTGGAGGIGLRLGNTSTSSLVVYGGNVDNDFGTKYLQVYGNTGNLLIQNGGTFTDSGQRLQVQGTTLLNGNVTFSSSTGMFWDATNSRLGIGTNAPAVKGHVVYSDNTFLNGFYVQNTNTGSNAYTGIGLQDAAGSVVAGFQYVPNTFTNVTLRNTVLFASTGLSKLGFVANSGGVSSTAQDIYFQTLSAKFNMYLYGATGNLVIQNGGTFTDSGERLQVTGTAKITSKLSMGAGTTSAAQINLASSTAPTSPANGDIWFDGTDIKMRIGGVTKTFTLV